MAFSGVMSSMNSQLTIITGAKSQAALHSMRSSEIEPSGVVSSTPMPRCLVHVSSSTSPPITAHSAVVQTPTWY